MHVDLCGPHMVNKNDLVLCGPQTVNKANDKNAEMSPMLLLQ